MVTEHGRKRLPPYISYRTFFNFIESLRQRVPSRIDRSFWEDRLSGSTGTQLMAALRFLDLIDENGRPTKRLEPLVSSRDEQRLKALHDIAANSFGFVLSGAFDPQNATYSELEDIFKEKFQLTGQLSRKCLKFFIELSNNGGITLSPFITKKFRSGQSSPSSKLVTKKSPGGTKLITKSMYGRKKYNLSVQNGSGNNSSQDSLDKILLEKFPTFDPSWPDEVKIHWFSAFDELMRKVVSHTDLEK
jgi:hypothetical protein